MVGVAGRGVGYVPQGGVALGCADNTQAITLAHAAPPITKAQVVTDRTGVWMADTG